ncbi:MULTISPECIES: signal peptidase I [Methylovorus]|jgi:signal peptidase I|uniref:Signal peptidase I n=1 Tax=Methylovorus glucosotrophus (strain SIP3-4) TaxID=582744 RepID=C6X6N4_METGS|nr:MULTISPECIES: signal peptidase I [Methylovorus]ACT51027.1 signal peptidase I [Methylovorus glucosotrophus SIP3-4]ADQ84938.1 signal peptidase I [Methylovorus sp. MP688]KAF0843662.1 signal peptidase I [Methylovorus glucosotrophus]
MMFALFMVVILAVTGLIWLLDILVLKKRRPAGKADPVLVEYSKSFFPVILVVFMIRSFVVEPFKIPSASMMPTLIAGDFILVNKFIYGLRVPILNNTFLEIRHPQRGEVFVFHYPKDPSIDYIKRVVGVPGDKIAYRDKQLYINGKKLDVNYADDYQYVGSGLSMVVTKRYQEQLGEHKHDILLEEEKPSLDGEVEVPPGHYFAMGDNRDNSNDSRFWGFVPEENLVGKAFFIWWNFDNFGRIGNTIN